MVDDLSLMIVVSTLKYIGDIAPSIASVFRWLMRIQMLQRLSIGSQLCVDAYSFVFVFALDFSLLQFKKLSNLSHFIINFSQ